MRSIIITISFVVCFSYPAFAYDYNSIPANSWVRLSPTGGPLPPGIDAYSGMAYDKSGKLLVFGGGHNDYWKNDTWVFNIANNTWSQAYTPDPSPIVKLNPLTIFNCGCYPAQYPGSMDYSGTPRPLARHTYGNIEMAYKANGDAFMFVTGKYGPAAGTSGLPWSVGSDTWAYFPASDWQHLGNHPGDGEGSSIFVPHGKTNGGKIYTITAANSSAGQTLPRINAYDVETGAWSTVSTTGMSEGIPHKDHSAAYDSRDNAIYLFSGEAFFGTTPQNTNSLWRLDLNSMNWQKMNPSGTPPPADKGQGITYDSINHVLISVYVASNNVSTYVYDITNNQWLNLTSSATGNRPNVSGSRRVYSRLRFDSVNNITFLVAVPNGSSTLDVWAYRYKLGNPDTSPPTNPGNLNAAAAGETQVNLTWNGSSDADSGVSGYRIYRAVGGSASNATLIGSVTHSNSDPQSFTDTLGLTASTQYTYKVSAVNLSGYESTGATTSVSTLADVVAPSLTSVNANIDPNMVTLTFSEDIDNTTGNNAANYSISGGIVVNSANTVNNRVTLSTSTLSEGVNYTLVINNLKDTANPANTITADTTEVFTYVTALNLTPPVTGSTYTWGSMNLGTTVYSDESFAFNNVASKFLNHKLLQTANSDKQANTTVSFSSNMNVTLFLGHYLDGINQLPTWIKDGGWVQTNDVWVSNDRTLYVYVKDYPAGNIVLEENGANTNSSSMYSVLVAPQGSIAYSIKQSNGGNGNPISTQTSNQVKEGLNTISTGAMGILDLIFLFNLGISLILWRQRRS